MCLCMGNPWVNWEDRRLSRNGRLPLRRQLLQVVQLGVLYLLLLLLFLISMYSASATLQDYVSRRCFEWTGADADVCFTTRPAGVAAYDATFSVFDFEKMLWGVHKAVIGTDVSVQNDKYNDNHYAVDIQVDLSYISTYFTTNYAKSFPIRYPYTQWAWDCDQNYLIDPTGWAIQCDAQFSTQLPGCEDSKQH